MKELSIKQKAQRYDEALERANSLLSNNQLGNAWIYELLPELKESEDEKIRKLLVEAVIQVLQDQYCSNRGVPKEKVVAWIERQDEQKSIIEGTFVNVDEVRENFMQEVYRVLNADPTNDRANQIINAFDNLPTSIIQKPADKAEPKFKIGDWVVSPNGVYWHIDDIQNERYHVSSDSGSCAEWPLNTNIYHKFTIQDAKDGDVLACDEEILLFKSYSIQGRISSYCWYNGQTNKFHSKEVNDTSVTTRNKICPATKEQRDTLMRTMADAGYTFDFKKKELKKIEQETAWSEEDEERLIKIIEAIKSKYDAITGAFLIEWIKSLKDGYTWKPSELQIEALESATANCAYSEYEDCLKELIKQLKQL